MQPTAVIVGVAVITGAVLAGLMVRRRRARTADTGQATHPLAPFSQLPLPQFNIVAVGLPGSGKTVLLASMYNQFHVPMAGRSFYLEASDPDARMLNGWFRRITDTTAPHSWPAGTSSGEFRRLHFAAAAPVQGAWHRAFTIRYTEYAGELLTADSEAGSRHQDLLKNDIAQAHAVMALLDGYDVLQILKGDRDADGKLQHAISTFIDSLRHVTCSVNFVVTKWDLLQQTGMTDVELVRRVSELLKSNDAFKWLVVRQDPGLAVRLFPVSAVGPGFATIDEQGRVIKTMTSTTRPTGVTLPFSSVLPDIFDRAEVAARNLAREHRRRVEGERVGQQRQGLRRDVLGSALLEPFGAMVPGIGITMPLFRWIVGVDPRIRQHGGLPPEVAWLESHDAHGGAGIEAARLIVNEMRREMDTAEGALPGSILRSVS